MGYLLVVSAHAANIYDGKAARQVLMKLFVLLQSVKIIWADRRYSGRELFDWVFTQLNCHLEIVKRQKGHQGFHVLPRRWIVERTFAWLSRSRRLSQDDEREPRSSESQVDLASSRNSFVKSVTIKLLTKKLFASIISLNLGSIEQNFLYSLSRTHEHG
ncbi:transposase [Thiocapsa imhoffii]|nr:transposase [Thiocapsa imhoffii]